MMSEHFNRLTPAEQERLVILAEECSEVIQAVSKILRHGYESRNPKGLNSETNRQGLERELGDLFHAFERLCSNGDIEYGAVEFRGKSKPAHIAPYLHHQGDGK
jgi:hypothetical protein